MQPSVSACRYAALTLLFSFLVVANVSVAQAQVWGCYDPEPGHPTPAERSAFLSDIRPLVREAEAKFGVPAAALAAMAALESGYGFTRTAKYAGNLFGWKQTDPSAPAYVLECQPAEDKGNRYVIFSDRKATIDHVASRLARSSYYKSDAEVYLAARKAGEPVEIAVNRWIDGISDPYNWKPAEYAAALKELIGKHGLYQWSQAGGGSDASDSQTTSNALAHARIAWQRKLVSNGRYMEQDCRPAMPTGTLWDAFPVQSCDYESLGVRATVRMLNPSADQLSAWTVNACVDVGAENIVACIDRLVSVIWEASNAQFPVAGYVVEPASAAGGTGNEALCLYFRDGVTATTKSSSTTPADKLCDPHLPDGEQIMSAKRYARIGSTTREMYQRAGGQEPVGRVGDIRWAAVIGQLYREAWTSDRNFLLFARANEEKAAGRIQ